MPPADYPLDEGTVEESDVHIFDEQRENRPEEQLSDDRGPQQKRRRRRRGRGGSRQRDDVQGRQQRTHREPRRDFHDSEHHDVTDHDLSADDLIDEIDPAAVDFASADDHFEIEMGEAIEQPIPVPSESHDSIEENGDALMSDGDDLSSGKSSVRDIVTWKEAIGMIIDGNMQARANSPQGSQNSHGGSRGHGHNRGGRSRGGRGRGGHGGGHGGHHR